MSDAGYQVDFPTLWVIPSWVEAHLPTRLSEPHLYALMETFRCDGDVLPAVYAGPAKDGDRYSCADNGCGCGWVYAYVVNEPMVRWT